MDAPAERVRFEVPATFRNWNFAVTAVVNAILALLMLWLNLVSSWGLEWLGVALLAWFSASALYGAASWLCATLRVEFDFVQVGGLVQRRRFTWDEVQAFSIMPPAERTPFKVTGSSDQARITLVNGTTYRVRALQPRHGSTALTYFRLVRETDADRTVEALNHFRQMRTQFSQPDHSS